VQAAILALLKENPQKTYRQLERDVNKIVSASTIERGLKLLGTCIYTERFLPLLTPQQREKHVAFAMHLRNYWGREQQKYLLIHYDEKWFYGMLARSNCKHCPALGLGKRHRKAQHKQATNKVMSVAFVGYAFDGCFENGGHGVKLGIYRAQKAKIAARIQRAATRDGSGKVKYNGETLREKGDAYLVDCNVTGSNTGTASDPKFALKDLFEETVFPAVEELIGAGGKYEGYLPVFQGDNAGPHVDSGFDSYVKGECGQRGWMWEPQAPQMPHMNVLDLGVFPSMSKRHSNYLAKRGGGVPPANEIWDACEQVWEELDSATIARAFVTAYRLAGKVIEHKGSNDFLRTDETHLGCRRDFRDTDFGIQLVTK
jgi:Transposase